MENVIKSIDHNSKMYHHASPGDVVVSINGNKIHDVLDYKFYSYDRKLTIVLRTPEGKEKTVRIRKNEGEDLGLDFETYLMDKPRSCANNCVFCFIDQLPPGMRPTMYFKDDDARLSFLLGNYVTLTNFSPREVQRIMDLHISPINVSVHATDPELRCRMLRNPRAGESLEIMRKFADAGITMNCQIVCCPGLNDGDQLDRTMHDLADLWPAVHSVSIVPVGLTRFREGLYPLEKFTPEHSLETIRQVTEFGDRCLQEHGSRIFWCGDEMYLRAGLELPPDEFYEEYTQLENGIGMLRLMETEFHSALKLAEEPVPGTFSVATGAASAPLMKQLAVDMMQKFPGRKCRVYEIRNDFFGPDITVAGLTTGQDLIAQLKGKDLGEYLLISKTMLRQDEQDFLDDVTLKQASEELGVPVVPNSEDGFELCDAFLGILPAIPEPVYDREPTEYYPYNQNK